MSTFNWSNFEMEFISNIVYNPKTLPRFKPSRKTEDKDMLIPTMEKIAPYPTKEFIVNYREEIESKLLIRYPELVEKIYKDVSGYRTANYRGMLNELSKMELGATLIGRYINAISCIGNPNYSYETTSLFRQPVTIDLTRSIPNELKLYDFQKDAIEKLKEDFITNDKASGMLIMPTGSGKTMTATHFILKEMISKGYQVIWLTHRHMLIDQTASSFYSFSPLVKLENPKKKKLKITCVSGEHSSIRATEKNDDIMIISVQSGFRNLDYLKTVLGKKVMIVVDEAHHTVAMSYRRIIDYIRKRRKDVKLLGLTATPIRGVDDESRYLHKLFEDNIIYNVSMGELIKKQILANPIFEKIETNANFEPFISIDEVELMKKFGEIPATLADKIAKSSSRNKIIVDTYMENKDRYGKTLIFALNAFHCYTLSEEFRKRKIKCDYIYSGNRNNEEKIRRFKENELDVLVNINILTEGSDVPDIQTIFLTRPTQSEGLLVQMVGRGLRGKFSGGTEEAIIVDFCDKWDTFNKWINPEWLFDTKGPIDPPPGAKPNEPRPISRMPWKVIGEMYKEMRFEGDQSIIRSLKLPIGWYPILDDEGEDYTMIVWDDQVNGFANIIKDIDKIIKKENLNSEEVILEYFGGFNMPPRKKDIGLFISNLRNNDTLPELFKFEERNKIDPVEVAKMLFEKNIGIADLLSEVEKVYEDNKEIIEDLYVDFSSYYSRVMGSLQNIDKKSIPISEIVEVPVELLPYKIQATHNLKELMKEVIDEMFQGEYSGIESINWTDKAYIRYYGMYYQGGNIRINKMLDSPEVDREVIKFLIYHELLHRDYWKHDKSFYREEHKYPNYTEHNRFLDHKIYNYKMQM